MQRDIEIGFLSYGRGRQSRRRAFIIDNEASLSRKWPKAHVLGLLQFQRDWSGRSLRLPDGLLSFMARLRLGQDYVGRIAQGFE